MAPSTRFKPHGLITTLPLEDRYRKRTSPITSKECMIRKGTKPSSYWRIYLIKVIFRDYSGVFVNSQQPLGIRSNVTLSSSMLNQGRVSRRYSALSSANGLRRPPSTTWG